VRTFRHCNFADQRSGRVYLQLVCGSLSWMDPEALTQAISDADTRAGLHAVAPGALQLAANAPPVPSGPATPSTPLPPIFLAREERLKTVGRWGLD
jgi:hypothetical protein